MICDQCGQEIAIGDWPYCPHGRSQLAAHPDDVPGGFIVENGFEGPRRFDSHSAHERALAEAGYEIRAKWAGPNDQHLTRWDSVDLDAAAALVSRGGQARARRREFTEVPITRTVGDSFTGSDLE